MVPDDDDDGNVEGTPTTFGKRKAPLRVLSNANGVLPSPSAGDDEKVRGSSPPVLASSPLARGVSLPKVSFLSLFSLKKQKKKTFGIGIGY